LWIFTPEGGNLTPDKLNAAEGAELLARCDQHLRELVELLDVERIIGVGNHAYNRITALNLGVKYGKIPHPSPASPLANRNGGKDWRDLVRDVLIQD